VCFEIRLEIQKVEWNTQLLANAARSAQLRRTAAVLCELILAIAAFAPKPHHHANNIITALDEERGGGRTVYAAAHRDDDGFPIAHWKYYLRIARI
jgi:hypothetical protein